MSPRAKGDRTAPSASNKYARSLSGAGKGKQLQVGDVTDAGSLFELVQDCVLHEVPVTIGRTKDGSAVTVSFYAAGERWSWYITNHADWEVMLSELASE